MTLNPFAFIRIVTVSLGALWTLTALVRIARFSRRWREKLSILGIEDRWWRRQVRLACLRATVLDPINLALMLVLLGLWTLRGVH